MKKQCALVVAVMLLATVGARSEAGAASFEDVLAKPAQKNAAKLVPPKTSISMPTLQRYGTTKLGIAIKAPKTGISMPTLQRYRTKRLGIAIKVPKTGISMPTLQRYGSSGTKISYPTLQRNRSQGQRPPTISLANLKASVHRAMALYRASSHALLVKCKARQTLLQRIHARLRSVATRLESSRQRGSLPTASLAALREELRAELIRANQLEKALGLPAAISRSFHDMAKSFITNVRARPPTPQPTSRTEPRPQN